MFYRDLFRSRPGVNRRPAKPSTTPLADVSTPSRRRQSFCRSPDVRIADIIQEFELETYAEHIARAEAMQRDRRPPAPAPGSAGG